MTRSSTRAAAGATLAALALAAAPFAASAAPTGAAPSPSPAPALGAGAAPASGPAAAPGAKDRATRTHDLPNPLEERRRALQEEAVAQLVTGKARLTTRGGDRVIAVKGKGKGARTKYAWYPVEREEAIFTVLTDFGDQTKEPQGGTPGPVHDQIPQPDRSEDNSTYWEPTFDRQHYLDLMFGEGESFKDFYLKQSNGRFLASGDVSDWVSLPFNEARYGHNPVDGDGTSEAEGYWAYVRDTATAWYDAQKAAGKTDAEIRSYLAQFDQVDRYDYDGDGVFTEPDGYIDHFQAIHAGEGEEGGGGAQGEDAIWSHRWYAYSTDAGKTGPSFNKLGGVPLGDSGMWIGDYTTEPENGGLGVFTHEFGHDLGLRDYYDTAGGDNGTGFWTLMSGGSWLGPGTDAIGTRPGYMGPHEKQLLGWLDATTVDSSGRYELGPADRDSTTRPQALTIPLPDKEVTTEYNTPHSGSTEWWSGSGDSLTSTLARPVDLTGRRSASLSAWVWYDVEQDYDYWFAEVSTDGGASWTDLTAGGVTGSSDGWVQRSWDLSAYAGRQVQVRFRYSSDGGVNLKGLFVDDITVTADGATLLSDDVESGDAGWTARGFTRIGGSVTKSYANYYLVENRVYSGYDRYLRTGPYNFGWASTRPDWVEHFPYQNGMLVWYVDTSYQDNNTSEHPGSGFALPVDARPTPIRFPDGRLLGNRRQPFDATFGTEKTDPVTFHRNGVAVRVPRQPAIRTFDDAYPTKYWTADNPMGSVQVAGSGAKVTVLRATGKNHENLTLQVTAPQR